MSLRSEANEIYIERFGESMALDVPMAHVDTFEGLDAMRGRLSDGEYDAIEAALTDREARKG